MTGELLLSLVPSGSHFNSFSPLANCLEGLIGFANHTAPGILHHPPFCCLLC